MLLQHLGKDLRHRQVLEDALFCTQAQVAQRRHDAQFVAGQGLAGFASGNLINQAVNAQAVGAKGEKGAQIQRGVLADQLQLEAIAKRGQVYFCQ